MIFDWLVTATGAAVIGGGLVGLSAALLLVLTGRAMNLSEMLGSLLGGNEGLAAASIAFLAGLVLAPTVWLVLAPLPVAGSASNIPLVVVAGLLAGFGARLGSTGVSGQAILGLARLSKRALVAVVCLILGGIAGVFASDWVRSSGVPT
ncbi:MAG: YeeE/YedE family protein [Paracoccaceae bacterium]